MEDIQTITVWVEGFVAAAIGNHLVSMSIAWPWAYLIGGAGAMFLTSTVTITTRTLAWCRS